jgi:hypothetical protein
LIIQVNPTRVNAGTVSASDLSETLAENYAGCLEDPGRFEALQAFLYQFGEN